jgi:Leucine-rich repeat (LRR) protein
MYLSYYYDKLSKRNGGIKMTKMKKIAAMTAALLICAGNMGYMPESTKSIGSFTANAAEVAAESVEINETNFPDPVFRQHLAKNFDKNTDGRLSDKEIAAVTKIDVYDMGISDLTGIEYFENLAILECMFNKLTTIRAPVQPNG